MVSLPARSIICLARALAALVLPRAREVVVQIGPIMNT